MPSRTQVLAIEETYHIFNRSVGKEDIFSTKANLYHALGIIEYYRFPQEIRLSKLKSLPKDLKEGYLNSLKNKTPLVEIYSYAFMPNHYHLLVKQLQEDGILKFVSNFQNSFAKFFNLKNDRKGTLFQNSFKAKRIVSEEEFVHVSRYIHLNPVTSYLIKLDKLRDYPWTSFPLFINETAKSFINLGPIQKIFITKEKYFEFVSDQVSYQRELKLNNQLFLE
jgi:putative transposase